MQATRPSRTALRVALRRAAHQLYDLPVVFHDPIAVPILGPEYLPEVHRTATKLHKPFSVALRAFLVARSLYAEEALAQAVATGVTQYVLLGAGLDTFAYRNPYRKPPRLRGRPPRHSAMEARSTPPIQHPHPTQPHLRPGRLRAPIPPHPAPRRRLQPHHPHPLRLARRRPLPHPVCLPLHHQFHRRASPQAPVWYSTTANPAASFPSSSS